MHDADRQGVEPRLAESEARYHAVIENASDMIQSVRPNGTFEFVNRAWRQKLGYLPHEVEHLTIWDVIHPESIAHCQELFAKAIRGETVDHVRATFVAKGGQSIPVEGNATARFVDGDVVATHSFFRDITERLRAQELEERTARLEREQRARYLEKMAALGKLSAGLSHELNNPAAAARRASIGLAESLRSWDAAMRELIALDLNSVQWRALTGLLDGATDRRAAADDPDPFAVSGREDAIAAWLQAHSIDDAWNLAPDFVRAGITEDGLERLAGLLPASALSPALRWCGEATAMREHADVVAGSTHRISALVNAVKAYSFMDRAVEQVVDVHDGLESTLVILAHRLRDVTVRRDYDRSLPPVRVRGSGLNQVWTNIVDNAVDATNGVGALSIRTRRRNGDVVVEIEDDGCGIPQDQISRIFEPFFTTKAQGQGTGLGLDTAWRIVTEEHGGSIEAESTPGQTVFRVSLPLPG